ncbi:amidase [Ferrovibrio sp.]|uniref:amidase n=1 Tax=Ferrovibrio sp. TaxID=1917215 RepID=UPI0035B139B9
MKSRVDSRTRLETALARINDAAGEGSRAFTAVFADSARQAADAADARAKAGLALGPLDGSIISIKDLFDWPGLPTCAGSKILRDAAPAQATAPAIARLRQAGAVIIGKTNMSEFAFSGVGINPHYGTPGNPADRTRIPGGSSSGAAISVADGMAEIGIGTDTGGSTRIPAALCGLVGFKPSQYRITRDGAFPLSYTLDSIGPLAPNVAACALADAAMAGDEIAVPQALPLAGLRLGIAKGPLLDGMEPAVAAAFEAACTALQKAGARIVDHSIADLLTAMAEANATGGFTAPEAYQIHRAYYDTRAADFDPLVHARIARGKAMSAADYIALSRRRSELLRRMTTHLAGLDALILPTTPIQAPKIADLATADAFNTANMALLRNTAPFNFFDMCAISLPLKTTSGLPAGLMLAAPNGQDKALFGMALSAENVLKG